MLGTHKISVPQPFFVCQFDCLLQYLWGMTGTKRRRRKAGKENSLSLLGRQLCAFRTKSGILTLGFAFAAFVSCGLELRGRLRRVMAATQLCAQLR